MTRSLPNSAQRVQKFLSENGFSLDVVELTHSTRTALEAAQSVGCNVGQIAKSLVFKETDSKLPLLIIASGSNRVDIKKVEKATGLRLGRADGRYVKENIGFAIGGVPPVGHTTPLRTILDPDLKQWPVIWAAAGTPRSLFQLSPHDLAVLTKGEWLKLAE